MNHLTDEQVSALLDLVLPAAELAACEAHLAGCDACRARLAQAAALDESLEKSLAHDPGEAYFESFADRVAARIAAEGGGTRPVATKSRTLWDWWRSPRGLTLAGSTAALMLVAGLAWVRFHEQGGRVSNFRGAGGSPVGEALDRQSAPAPAVEQAQPQADFAVPAPESERVMPPVAENATPAKSQAAAPALTPPSPQGSMRMQEVRRDAQGVEIRAREEAPAAGARTPAAGSTTTLGMMKQRAVAPATGAPAAGVTSRDDSPTPPAAAAPGTASKRAAAPSSNEAPAARSLGSPSLTEGVARVQESQAPKDARVSAEALAPCGTVHDSQGRPVTGAQVMVVNDITRSSRTGPDGSFCLPRLERGDVLSVLRVGYEPVRLTVGESSPLAVVMEPVGTLGPEAGKGLHPPGSPSALGQAVTPQAADKALSSTAPKASAPVPDVYASQSLPARNAVTVARESARVARRDRSADAMDAAALRWDAVAALVTGAALHDARFQSLSLRREALSTTPTTVRLTRFDAELRVFLAQAPKNSPEYATALRWKSVLEPGNKALYR